MAKSRMQDVIVLVSVLIPAAVNISDGVMAPLCCRLGVRVARRAQWHWAQAGLAAVALLLAAGKTTLQIAV